jgi:hypothetical protein
MLDVATAQSRVRARSAGVHLIIKSTAKSHRTARFQTAALDSHIVIINATIALAADHSLLRRRDNKIECEGNSQAYIERVDIECSASGGEFRVHHHEENESRRVPISPTSKRHRIEHRRHMMMAIIRKQIMHRAAIPIVGQLNLPIPSLRTMLNMMIGANILIIINVLAANVLRERSMMFSKFQIGRQVHVHVFCDAAKCKRSVALIYEIGTSEIRYLTVAARYTQVTYWRHQPC